VKQYFRLAYVPLLLLSIGLSMLQCVSVRMSDKAVAEYFAQKPVRPTFHRIRVNGQTLHYAQIRRVHAGADSLPLVVFVHGSPGAWDAFITFFADSSLYRHAQLVSVDRPGFGKSGLGQVEPSLQRQAAAIAAVIDTLRPGGRAVLVGHSLGGPVIARLAMDYPDRVQSLILVAPSIDPALEKQEWFRPMLAAFPLRQLLPVELSVSNLEIKPLRGELTQMLPGWANLRMPVTVIQGDQDDLVPPGNADFARRMLTNAPVTIQMLPGMNHFIPWRRPDTIHDAILKQLKVK
jgi:pimeloyl-ACP methyl ester carboxylesterase